MLIGLLITFNFLAPATSHSADQHFANCELLIARIQIYCCLWYNACPVVHCASPPSPYTSIRELGLVMLSSTQAHVPHPAHPSSPDMPAWVQGSNSNPPDSQDKLGMCCTVFISHQNAADRQKCTTNLCSLPQPGPVPIRLS